jgi:hypothetical protein
MKKLVQYAYCSRCGDDLDTQEEIETDTNPVCLWCQHMQADAFEINWHRQQIKATKLEKFQ